MCFFYYLYLYTFIINDAVTIDKEPCSSRLLEVQETYLRNEMVPHVAHASGNLTLGAPPRTIVDPIDGFNYNSRKAYKEAILQYVALQGINIGYVGILNSITGN